MARVILFDVNETLLDLSVLQPHFEHIFGDSRTIQTWFAQLLHSSLVVTLTGAYTDFGTLAGAVLDGLAASRGIALSTDARHDVLATMEQLPPHPEVTESLERLRSAGLRLATLTNSSSRMLSAQMTHAGLNHHFDMLLSVEEVRRFKPAPETYHMASEKLGVRIEQIRLVAAHDWDVVGALRAGGAGAFVARSGQMYNMLYEKPDVLGVDLREVTNKILEIER